MFYNVFHSNHSYLKFADPDRLLCLNLLLVTGQICIKFITNPHRRGAPGARYLLVIGLLSSLIHSLQEPT